MPRAFDPSMPGGGLPITHDPQNRVGFNVKPGPKDALAAIRADQSEERQQEQSNTVQDVVVPLINSLFSIDLSSWIAFLFGFGAQTGMDPTEHVNQTVAHTAELTAHTEAIANLEEITSAMNTTVAYVGDLEDMVTIERGQLVTVGPASAKAVDIAVGFSVLDTVFGWCMPVIKPFNTPLTSRATIYYTPIVTDRKGILGKIRWIVGADVSVFPIDYYEMALCIYNPTNGNIEKLWGSGNIKDGVANTTTMREVEIDMGLTDECKPGQILFAAHQQTASGVLQETRTFAAVPQGEIGRPDPMLLDAWCYTAPDFSQGIPSSIALDSLVKENRFCPWTAVSATAIVEP